MKDITVTIKAPEGLDANVLVDQGLMLEEEHSQGMRKKQGKKRYGQQGTADLMEQLERAEQMRTSGRKGCHAPRINLAFTPSNYDFVRVTSCLKGMSLTQYVNYLIEQYRAEHSGLYEKAKDLIREAEKK